jgi:hypothetical protein
LQSQSSWASSVAASVFASVTRKHLSVGRRRARRYLHHANDAKAKLAAAKKKTICKNDLKKANLTLATKQNCLDFSTFYFYFDTLPDFCREISSEKASPYVIASGLARANTD